MASPSPLCPLENAARRLSAGDLKSRLADQFIASHAAAPKEFILDFGESDDAVDGGQEGCGLLLGSSSMEPISLSALRGNPFASAFVLGYYTADYFLVYLLRLRIG